MLAIDIQALKRLDQLLGVAARMDIPNSMDHSALNSWLGLLVLPAQPHSTPRSEVHSNAFKRIYTYNHPAVIKARQLYSQKRFKNSEIARAVGVHAKAISRWLEKGLLTG